MTDTILVVSEDVNTRSIEETLVRSRFAHVRSVRDATEACDILCCEGVALVVVDLPQMKGLEVLRRLCGRWQTQVLPTQPQIVVVADWPEQAIERLALRLGADAFLRKPLRPERFLETIQQLVAPTDLAYARAANA